MKTHYSLNIGGNRFSIQSEEKESYIRLLEKELNIKIREVEALGASTQNAAMFVLLDTYDALVKALGGEPLRSKDKDKEKGKSKFDALLVDKSQVSLF